jgi:hypothetical protein
MPNNPNAAANLKPFKKGEVHSPNGRGKGNLNFNTMVKNLLEDDKLVESITKGKRKPQWITSTSSKRMNKAIVVAIMVKALQGDVRAADWVISKGYGNEFQPEAKEDKEIVVSTFPVRRKDG